MSDSLALNSDSLNLIDSLSLGDSSQTDSIIPPQANPLDFHFSPRSLSGSARGHKGLFPREYEFPGARAEVLQGLSFAGPVGFRLLHSSVPDTRELPHGTGGYWSPAQSEHDFSTLNLTGANGILRPLESAGVIDTPLVDMTWERGAFTGNSFQLNFHRLMTDSVMLSFQIESHSNDSAALWRYQDNLHQPYLSLPGIKRDSAEIPFNGRNLQIDSRFLSPGLTWFHNWGEIHLYAGFHENKSQDAAPLIPESDSLQPFLITDFAAPAFRPLEKEKLWGGKIVARDKKLGEIQLEWKDGSLKSESEFLTPYFLGSRVDSSYDASGKLYLDTSLQQTGDRTSSNTLYRSGKIKLVPASSSFWYPSLQLEGSWEVLDEFPQLPKDSLKRTFADRDRELGWVEFGNLEDSLTLRFQTGVLRNSSPENKVEFFPQFSVESRWLTTFSELRLWSLQRVRHPTLRSRYHFRTGRLAFPAPGLRPELSRKHGLSLNGGFARFHMGASIEYEKVEDYIAPQAFLLGSRDTISDTTAFTARNYPSMSAFQQSISASLELGRWIFEAARRQSFFRRATVSKRVISPAVMLVPEYLWQGSIRWQRAVLQNRLGLSVRWDWELFGPRDTWAWLEKNRALLIHQEGYLVLDFEARMKIQAFQLYYRIDNFNHSIYRSDVGYTPIGVNFRWGIFWQLKS